MSLEDRLKVKRLALIMKLDDELAFVDRKERVPEIKILQTISRIDGFLLGMSYMRQQYNDYNKKTYAHSRVPGGNSILDNEGQYRG